MFDILVASGLLAAIVAVVTRPVDHRLIGRDRRQTASTVVMLGDHDLPCPWCRAATREDDERCPSCRQRFG